MEEEMSNRSRSPPLAQGVDEAAAATLPAARRTRRPCPSAPQVRRWGDSVPSSNSDVVDSHGAVSAASVRQPSSAASVSVSPLPRGHCVRGPRAAAVRAPRAAAQDGEDARLVDVGLSSVSPLRSAHATGPLAAGTTTAARPPSLLPARGAVGSTASPSPQPAGRWRRSASEAAAPSSQSDAPTTTSAAAAPRAALGAASLIASHLCGAPGVTEQEMRADERPDACVAGLGHDADVWARHLCEEQRLLHAQLGVAQARAAALEEEVRALRGGEAALAAEQPVAVGSRPSHDAVGGDAMLSSSHGSVHGEDGPSPSAADVRPGDAVVTADAAYRAELEALVYLLEQRTHSLHAESLQLQVQLEHRTNQLATAQRRHREHYSRLMSEQSVLERDHRKATEDVEELVGMLIVARAAERAALRRVEECELALEVSEARADAFAAALQPHASERDDDDNDDGSGGTPSWEPRTLGEPGDECASGLASYPPSSSAFVSFLEHQESGRAAAPRRVSLERPHMLAWRGMSRSTSPHIFSSPAASSLVVDSPTWLPAPPPLAGDVDAEVPPHHRLASPPPSAVPLHVDAAAAGSNDVVAGIPCALSTPMPSLAEDGAPAGDAAAAQLTWPSTPPPRCDVPVTICAEESATAADSSSSSRGGRASLHAPLVSSTTAQLTPRGVARRRHLLEQRLRALHRDPSDAVDERQVLHCRCQLLELEVRDRELAHAAERTEWEVAVQRADGVAGAVGEVEARVRQAAAASEKIKSLVHEMGRLWSNSLALEDEDISDDDVDVDAAGRAAEDAVAWRSGSGSAAERRRWRHGIA
ncbi:hypothetical protein NESM_000818600 [Novymonas esmeraldas]|uniref:Uncharacterized protein n=1 Tax=Novymonas esmeraldas TaxID=1808958 RepID=A0AAW0EYH8_9TRYP